jgi:CRISPR-associated endonuclease/helicase Cas3
MKEFFKNKLGYYPYLFQEKVNDSLQKGKNIILSVPTGAGKTWASIIPFLYALENPEIHFPKKMIYSLPLRTLANSIFVDVSKIVDGASIQTGEYSDDKYFEKDIIFSTIDQTLSNFLCFPLPLSPRQANVNAGALIGSYLVFDEFHLLDEKLSMATTIGSLKMLGNLSRCCIMTATLSSGFMELLQANLPNYEIITLDDFPEDKIKIGSLKPEIDKKKIQVLASTISGTKIIEYHNIKSIVICNRVETAQKIYNELIEEQKKATNEKIKKTKIICLHSRFFDNDRKEKEIQLKKLFGKEANNESVILVSTQVIEAGMDISCEVMHTEISPINSFLQRVGRCARFSNQMGLVFIYDILEIDEKEKIKIEPGNREDKDEIRKLNNKYLPYDFKVCEKTYDELKKYKTLDGNIPNELIENILGGEEKELINKMKTGQGGGFNQDKIRESWDTCTKNNYRNTIRDIQSVEITLITDEMCDNVAKYPYRYQSLGMYKWSFVGWLNKIGKSDDYDTEDWLVKELKDNVFIGEIENDEEINYQLVKITEFNKIPNQVYVNAKYFGYDASFGFNWQYTDTFGFTSPQKDWKEKKEEFKALTKDTFFQHNMGLMGAFEIDFLGINKDKFDFIFKELAKFIEEPELNKGDFIKLIELMIIMHDYGKLNTSWQKPMQQYQALKEGISLNQFNDILGHTDYNDKDEKDKDLAKKALLSTRPAHAGIGAYALQEIISELYDNDYLKNSISVAIARHHSPLSISYPGFTVSDTNYIAMQVLLKKFGFDVTLIKKDEDGEIDGFVFEGNEEYLVYLFFVRILRLCDQKATENLNKYFN